MSLTGFKGQGHPQQTRLTDPAQGALFAAARDIDDRATTAEVFDPLHALYGFTIDAAAAAHNTKLPRYYDVDSNGLEQSWAGERVWCNPPYSDIAPWVAKANAEESCPLVVMLLPANRTEQRWWHDHVEPVRDRAGSPLRIQFLPGRMRFLRPGRTEIGPNERPPFGVLLAIWDRRPNQRSDA
jgi:phage N-6-adenine-methyltransferase